MIQTAYHYISNHMPVCVGQVCLDMPSTIEYSHHGSAEGWQAHYQPNDFIIAPFQVVHLFNQSKHQKRRSQKYGMNCYEDIDLYRLYT